MSDQGPPPPHPGPHDPSGQPAYQGQPQPPPGHYAQPGAYGQPVPPKKDNTTRTVLLVIGGIVLLLLGGCAAVAVVAGVAFNRATDGFDEIFETEPPIQVTEGDGFTYAGFEIESGWKVGRGDLDGLDITGLRATNISDSADSFGDQQTARFEFQLFEGNTLLTETTCRSQSIREDEASLMECTGGTFGEASGFDTIKVADVF